MKYRRSRFLFATQWCALLLAMGCNTFTDVPELPAGTQDINSFYDRDGAFSFYNYTVANFSYSFAMSALAVGLFTDELHAAELLGNGNFLTGRTLFSSDAFVLADARRIQEGQGGSQPYNTLVTVPMSFLHVLRADAMQGSGIFKEYTTEPSVFRGHLYAIIGYAEVQIADMFCSGVPLSTVDFKKNWTYRAGSTTTEVYEHAVALFDTAIALSADSARILNLARVGKGRALLALGRYNDAASAVASVPPDFQYQLPVKWKRGAQVWTSKVTMSDREGSTGLPYLSSRDPRTDSVFVGTNTYRTRLYLPKKYPLNVLSPFVIANGIEAQLIIAEAKLREEKPVEWLQIINDIRRTSIVPALPDLVDPGTSSTRVDLLFKERAFWMYMTGHRLGDLRRLVRQYQRHPNTVYPVGDYPGSGGNTYGPDVLLPIGQDKENYNPLFTGCLSYDA